MASLKQLIECFEDIKSSSLANGVIRQESIRDFVDILNRAIPSQFNTALYTIYRFNRSKYLLNKAKFVAEIKDFAPYDAMILWTDFSDILAFFGLVGKIFLGWDKKNNHYRGFILQPRFVKATEDVSTNATVEAAVDLSANAETQTQTETPTAPLDSLLETIVDTPVDASLETIVEIVSASAPTETVEPISVNGIFDDPVDSPVDVGAQVGVLSNDDIITMENDNDRVYDYMMQRIAAFTQRS